MGALDRVFDVVVIGGGLSGAAVARDCAMRRLSVALIEREDLGAGSSGRAPALLIESDRVSDVLSTPARWASAESATIQRIATNLVFRFPLLVPELGEEKQASLDRLEALAAAAARRSAAMGGAPGVRLSGAELVELDPAFSSAARGAVAFDVWAVDPLRLVALTAKGAASAGAEIVNGATVERIDVQDRHVTGVQIAGRATGRRIVRARTVVDASGASVGRLIPNAPAPRTRKRVSLFFERRWLELGVLFRDPDGDALLAPYPQGMVLTGGDVDYTGAPAAAQVSSEEVERLLARARRYLPGIDAYRIVGADASVTTAGSGMTVRDYAEEGLEGVYTASGGSVVAHRLLAEETADRVCRQLRNRDRCRTHLESLPGSAMEAPWREESERTGIDPVTVRRLMQRHGFKALEILEAARTTPELARTLCECEMVLAAEADYAIREEWAKSLADVRRRTRLGAGPCLGSRCASPAGLFAARVLGWDTARAARESKRLQETAEWAARPALKGEQAKQADYARALRCFSGEDDACPPKR